MVFAGIFAGMSVERQLEAAQKFLRGIRSLTSYKQALWVCRKHWTKCSASRQLKRLRGWHRRSPTSGVTPKRSPSLRNVAVKMRPVESDQTRCLSLGMRRGKGCRQGLETPENLVALRAVGRCTSGCASTSNTTWVLFDSGFLRGSDECLA